VVTKKRRAGHEDHHGEQSPWTSGGEIGKSAEQLHHLFTVFVIRAQQEAENAPHLTS
jgi:hypothetical protein